MKIDNVRGTVRVYQSIPEQVASIISLTNDNIVIGDYSIYRGVLVLWDDDYDARVLNFIDNNEMLIPGMLCVSECKAYLTVLWLGKMPKFPKEMTGINKTFPNMVEVAWDSWQVKSYRTASQIWLPILKEYMLRVM